MQPQKPFKKLVKIKEVLHCKFLMIFEQKLEVFKFLSKIREK